MDDQAACLQSALSIRNNVYVERVSVMKAGSRPEYGQQKLNHVGPRPICTFAW